MVCELYLSKNKIQKRRTHSCSSFFFFLIGESHNFTRKGSKAHHAQDFPLRTEQSFVRRSLSRSTQKDWLLNSTPEEPQGASGCKGSEKSCIKDIYLILCCTLFTKCIWCSWPWTFPTSLSFQWASVSTRAVRYRSWEFNGLSKVTQLSGARNC